MKGHEYSECRHLKTNTTKYCAALLLCVAALQGLVGDVLEKKLTDWRFRPGRGQLSKVETEDGDEWKSVPVSSLRKLPWFEPIGCYRCEFTLDETWRGESLGLWLGRIKSSDEVYLNGERIGGEGVVGQAFVDASRKYRVYPLPSSSLRESNTLITRVQNSFLWGGFTDTPRIGAFQELMVERREIEWRIKLIEAVLLGIFMAVLLFWGALAYSGTMDKAEISLGWLILILAAIVALESLLFYDSGWFPQLGGRICVALFLFLPMPVLSFIKAVDSDKQARRFIPFAWWTLFILGTSYLVFGSLTLCVFLYIPYAILCLGVLWLLIRLALKTSSRRGPEVRFFMLGLVLLALCLAVDLLLDMSGSFWSRVPAHVGAVSLVLCITWGMGARFVDTQRSLRLLSRRTLAKQEEERKRIAYELHDGFGQTLLALRLNAQLLRGGIADGVEVDVGVLDRLIEETGAGCDRLRDIIRGLRPASLSELGFAPAVRELVNRAADQAGVTVQLEMEDDVVLPDDVELALYRIAQEAVVNALRHAEAGNIVIRFGRFDGGVFLDVADDGRGLPAGRDEDLGEGIGLLAMRERLTDVGGVLRISSEPNHGTVIRVEVKV